MNDLRKYILSLKEKPYECINTAIGCLCIYGISGRDYGMFFLEIGKVAGDCTPELFVRLLSRYICYPASALNDEKDKPDEPIFSRQNLENLTDDDLEKISKVYIENNEYLFKREIIKKEQEENNTVEISTELGVIEHPQKESESYVNYLKRLLIIDKEKHNKIFDEIQNKFMGKMNYAGFGSAVNDSWIMGEKLSSPLPQLQDYKFENLANIKSSETRAVEVVGVKIDKLMGAFDQTKDYIAKTYNVQSMIERMLDISGKETRKYSIINMILAIILLLITIIGMTLSYYIADGSNKKLDATIQVQNNLLGQGLTIQQEMVDELRIIRSSVSKIDSLEKLIDEMKRTRVRETKVE